MAEHKDVKRQTEKTKTGNRRNENSPGIYYWEQNEKKGEVPQGRMKKKGTKDQRHKGTEAQSKKNKHL